MIDGCFIGIDPENPCSAEQVAEECRRVGRSVEIAKEVVEAGEVVSRLVRQDLDAFVLTSEQFVVVDTVERARRRSGGRRLDSRARPGSRTADRRGTCTSVNEKPRYRTVVVDITERRKVV